MDIICMAVIAFIFHIFPSSSLSPWYFSSFLCSLFLMFLSLGIATAIVIGLFLCLSSFFACVSCLLASCTLLVCAGIFQGHLHTSCTSSLAWCGRWQPLSMSHAPVLPYAVHCVQLCQAIGRNFDISHFCCLPVVYAIQGPVLP